MNSTSKGLARCLTWPFLAAVALLLANDILFKYTHPGFVTGKVSDFAGLYVVGALATSFVPARSRVAVLGLLAALFSWWKSPASQYFIDTVNVLGMEVGRVVDFTDLAALAILPVCLLGVQPIQLPRSSLKRALEAMAVVLCSAAIMGTSFMPVRDEYTIRKSDPGAVLDRAAAEAAIVEVLTSNGLKRCTDCSDSGKIITYKKGEIEVWYRFNSSGRGIHFHANGSPGSIILGIGSSRPAIEAIQRQLKAVLGSKIEGLEFVVDLS